LRGSVTKGKKKNRDERVTRTYAVFRRDETWGDTGLGSETKDIKEKKIRACNVAPSECRFCMKKEGMIEEPPCPGPRVTQTPLGVRKKGRKGEIPQRRSHCNMGGGNNQLKRPGSHDWRRGVQNGLLKELSQKLVKKQAPHGKKKKKLVDAERERNRTGGGGYGSPRGLIVVPSQNGGTVLRLEKKKGG